MNTLSLCARRFCYGASVAILFSCVSASIAPAQVETGTISGAVRDASGAVVPAARILVTNLGTKVTRTTTSNATGDFSVPFLAPGLYDVETSAKGFKTFVQRRLTLNVAQTLSLSITLQLGSVEQQVVVVGQTPLLQTSSAVQGQIFTEQNVNQLPLNGRNFETLASLTAGTANSEPGSRNAGEGGFSSNGIRSYDNNIMLDGVDDNNIMGDLRTGHDFLIEPPPDAITQFNVETNGYGPEFGRGGGAAINLAFKSGTNNFHGDAWEFLENNALDARNFFDYVTPGAPPYKQNQYGFTMGGPVIIPKVYNGRDRLFFFGDFQGTRTRNDETFDSVVPTVSEKQGNFSDGFLGTITDPTTGQPFPNETIPVADMDPVALELAQLYPDPNLTGTDSYVSTPEQVTDVDQFDVRVDYSPSASTHFFFRGDYSNTGLYNPGPLPGLAVGGNNDVTQGNATRDLGAGAAFGFTYIFSPTTVNDFRAGYNRVALTQAQLNATVDADQGFGIPGIPFVSGVTGGLPDFTFSDVQNLGASGDCLPTDETVNVFTLRDVLTLVRGTHSINVGFEARPSEFTFFQPCNDFGDFGYNGQFTGAGFADFLLGLPDTASLSNRPNIDYKRQNYATFAGDTWRASTHLTLDYGLRWEYHSPVYERFNAQGALTLGNAPTYLTSSPVTLPSAFPFPVKDVGTYLSDRNFTDFAPRLGLAYQRGAKTVVRAAFGTFYNAEEVGTYSNPSPGFNPPFYINATFPSVSVNTVNPTVNRLGNGFPANAITSGFNPDSIAYVALQSNLQDAYVESWNLTLQRELSSSTGFELAYVGNHATHLLNFAPGNQATPSANPSSPFQTREPIPVLTGVDYQILSNLFSNYDALEVTLKKRLTHGLSLNAAYTWSHALDVASSSNLGSGNNGFFQNDNDQFAEYGNADFDTRNRIALFYEYQLPFGAGQAFGSSAGRLLNAVIGGWNTLGVWSYQTGNWFSPELSYDSSNSDSQDPLPNLICNPNQNAPHTTTAWFNTSCFAAPPEGSFGDAGRNVILGPSFFDADLSAMKSWNLSESRRIEFRAEFFNAFNHPTFPAVSELTFFDTPSFGQILSANPARQIQVALKFYW
jgi:Carboxypeptidase regulatory-like domain